MASVDQLFQALDWIAAGAFTLAVALVAVTFREIDGFRAAIFVTVGAMILRWSVWGFTTEASWQMRTLIGALIGAILLGGAPALLRWGEQRLRSTAELAERKIVELREVAPPVANVTKPVSDLSTSPVQNGSAERLFYVNRQLTNARYDYSEFCRVTDTILDSAKKNRSSAIFHPQNSRLANRIALDFERKVRQDFPSFSFAPLIIGQDVKLLFPLQDDDIFGTDYDRIEFRRFALNTATTKHDFESVISKYQEEVAKIEQKIVQAQKSSPS